jgi:outer membrane immunogenic protein
VAAPPVYSCTGFYIFGGGYGMFDSNTFTTTFPGGAPLTIGQKVGGDGFYGMVGAGYDWQFAGFWVAGVFADGQFGSIKGSLTDPLSGPSGLSGLTQLPACGSVRSLSYVNGGVDNRAVLAVQHQGFAAMRVLGSFVACSVPDE